MKEKNWVDCIREEPRQGGERGRGEIESKNSSNAARTPGEGGLHTTAGSGSNSICPYQIKRNHFSTDFRPFPLPMLFPQQSVKASPLGGPVDSARCISSFLWRRGVSVCSREPWKACVYMKNRAHVKIETRPYVGGTTIWVPVLVSGEKLGDSGIFVIECDSFGEFRNAEWCWCRVDWVERSLVFWYINMSEFCSEVWSDVPSYPKRRNVTYVPPCWVRTPYGPPCTAKLPFKKLKISEKLVNNFRLYSFFW